jgi:hypothetical protein
MLAETKRNRREDTNTSQNFAPAAGLSPQTTVRGRGTKEERDRREERGERREEREERVCV